MLKTTTIGLAALSLTLAALSPALADVGQCAKQPNADTCPTMGAPSKASAQNAPKNIRHTRYHAPQSPNKG
jgi:hypothetical protein